MFELITFNTWQIQDRCIVNASDCGRSSTFEQIADLSKNITRFNLAHIVFSAGEISASHSAHAFGQEVKSRSRTTLTYYNVLRQFLKRLTHRSDKLEFPLQDRICLDRFTK